MFVKTTDKWEAIRAFINTWLKDQTLYCNNCDKDYDPFDKDEQGRWRPCCKNPQIGRNIDHTMGIIKQNKAIRQTRKNEFASVENKTMRWGVSLPPRLLYALERYCKNQTGEKLFSTNADLHAFMKKFPVFCIPEEV